MKNIVDNMDFFNRLLDMLAAHLGPNCEIVLHDWSRPYEHTIVAIRNNNITHRNVDDCGSNLGLEIISGNSNGDDRYNYITQTKDGKILRSSSYYIRDDENKIIGALCINTDISMTVQFENMLRQYNMIGQENKKSEEYFANNLNEFIDYYIEYTLEIINKPIALMDKNDKIQFIGILDKRGTFLISKSSEKVSDLLGISKFTFYNYLDISRGKK